MATPQEIREWLTKMQYSDPHPSEKALELLCKGAMGPIFKQIIEKVKPQADVKLTKKSILVHQQLTDHTNTSNDSDDIPELKIYNEKRKLQKELNDLNANNIKNEANLQHLISQVKSKNAELQLIKQRFKETEKNIVLFKAKSASLDKQIEECEKLLEQVNILQNKTSGEDPSEKICSTLIEIEKVITMFDRQLSPPAQNSLLPIIVVEPVVSSNFSSNKKSLSISKRQNRANSTRKNIFESSNNLSVISSIHKRNSSKYFIHSFNNTVSNITSLPSTNNVNSLDKYSECMIDLEQTSWNNLIIRHHVEEMRHFGPDYVYELLNNFKLQQKKKLTDMIADNDNPASIPTSKTNSVIGLENLYSYHIQTELKRMKCDQERLKIEKMLETHMTDNIQDITILESTEFGLQNSISHLRETLSKMQEDFSDNTSKLDQILSETRAVELEMASMKVKIETNLCLLYDCNSWLDKLQKNVARNIKGAHFYSEYDLLEENTAEDEIQRFMSCPFQRNNFHYFDSWNQIYSSPELLEILQCPFLSPESAISLHSNQARWLKQLQSIEKEEANNCNSMKITTLNLINTEQFNACYKKSLDKLKHGNDTCRDVLSSLSDIKTEMKYSMEAPLNYCVAKQLKRDNKSLADYVALYDESYNQL